MVVEATWRVREGDTFTYSLLEGAPDLATISINPISTDAYDLGPLGVNWTRSGDEYIYTLSVTALSDSVVEGDERAEIVIWMSPGKISEHIYFEGGVRTIPIIVVDVAPSVLDQQKQYMESLEVELSKQQKELRDLHGLLELYGTIRNEQIVDFIAEKGLSWLAKGLVGLLANGQTAKDVELMFDTAAALGEAPNTSVIPATSGSLEVAAGLGNVVPHAKELKGLLRSFTKAVDLGGNLVTVASVGVLQSKILETESKIEIAEAAVTETKQKYDAAILSAEQHSDNGTMRYAPLESGIYEPTAPANETVYIGDVKATKLFDANLSLTGPNELVLGQGDKTETVTVADTVKVAKVDLGGGSDFVELRETNYSNSAVVADGKSAVISSDDRVIVLENVERVNFDDGTLALDLSGTAGQTYRLYQAAFARTPDTLGLSSNVELIDKGMSLNDMANAFVVSPEFSAKYGVSVSNAVYINALYNNVLGRDADAAGLAGWQDALSNGSLDRGGVLIGFSESDENIELVALSIEDGIWLG